jgi:hypothetical protein
MTMAPLLQHHWQDNERGESAQGWHTGPTWDLGIENRGGQARG